MRYTKIIATLLAIIFLTACSVMRGGISKTDLESSKKIAVVSLLGQKFHGIHVGTTVFGNTAFDASVQEWNIDGKAEQQIISHLRKTASRSAVALQHDPDLGSRLENMQSFVQGYNYQELINLAKHQGADTLILVQPVRYDNAPFHKPGYGFFERTFLGKSRRCLYSLFIMSAFSIDSGKKIGWEWGFPCESGETELEWKDSLDKYSEKEMQLLRRKTEESVKQNVMQALTVLGY